VGLASGHNKRDSNLHQCAPCANLGAHNKMQAHKEKRKERKQINRPPLSPPAPKRFIHLCEPPESRLLLPTPDSSRNLKSRRFQQEFPSTTPALPSCYCYTYDPALPLSSGCGSGEGRGCGMRNLVSVVVHFMMRNIV